MRITVIGAGNSGFAMAAHLSANGHQVRLWNRSESTIKTLKETHTIKCYGEIQGKYAIEVVTTDLKEALDGTEMIFITTPANSHRELAKNIARYLDREVIIVLNPGRTFGALEFLQVFSRYNKLITPIIAETQTIIYTCRKVADDAVNILALKSEVLLSTFDTRENKKIIKQLPACLQPFLKPARSMIETSVGNVGMILHCAPLLLNVGWTENKNYTYNYYLDGISPTIASFLEKIDEERVQVSERLGLKVESTKDWLKRTYRLEGDTLFECIQKNEAYQNILAPNTMEHRYIFEDIPFGLVPLEYIGRKLGLPMKHTRLIIDLASTLFDMNFRKIGRRVNITKTDLMVSEEDLMLA